MRNGGQYFAVSVWLGLIGVTVMSWGCYTEGNCPQPGDEIEMAMGDFGLDDVEKDPMSPLQEPDDEDEIYLRIVSEDLVELAYERDGLVVVETYAVTERGTTTHHHQY